MTRLRSFTRLPAGLLAEGFAFKLDENYSYERGRARSGGIDRRTGRPRSVIGEFPQEQTGLLRSAIFYEPLTEGFDAPVSFKVGLNADLTSNPSELMEYLAYIEGYTAVSASRFGLTITGESDETHSAMMRHLAENLPKDRFWVGV